MRHIILNIVIFTCFLHSIHAQVSVTNDNSLPDPSAMLDVKSSTKGILVPRMTIAQRDAIAEPATGLLVFCTDNNQYHINKGTPAIKKWVILSSQWVSDGNNLYFNDGNAGIGYMVPAQKLSVNGNIAAQFGSSNYAAYRFGDGSLNSGMSSPSPKKLSLVNNGVQSVRFDESGRVAVSSGLPATSAQLDVSSTNLGFLPPRMTTAQRDAIVTPVEGLMLYNTDENAINVFNGTSWAPVTPVVCGQPFTDTRDGRVYNTVKIGLQCWMKENLNLGIKIIGSVNQTNNGAIEKYCYDNLESNCDVYGGLYQWDELMNYTTSGNANPSGRQGICPTGWHVPSDAEWCQMETFLDASIACATTGYRGLDAGGRIKETGLSHWITPNTGATNSSGFTAFGGGYNNISFGGTTDIKVSGYFWSAAGSSTTEAYGRAVVYWSMKMYRGDNYLKTYGFSARCCMD